MWQNTLYHGDFMTVKELIQELSKYDDDLPVFTWGTYPVEKVIFKQAIPANEGETFSDYIKGVEII